MSNNNSQTHTPTPLSRINPLYVADAIIYYMTTSHFQERKDHEECGFQLKELYEEIKAAKAST